MALTSTRWMSPVPSLAELRAAARLGGVFLFRRGEGEFYFPSSLFFREETFEKKKTFISLSPPHVGRHIPEKPTTAPRGKVELAAKLKGLRDRGGVQAETRVDVFGVFLQASERE